MTTPKCMSIVACLASVLSMTSGEYSGYCLPGMSCFPSFGTFATLANTLDAGLESSILYPSVPEYANITIMKDTLFTRYPAYIVMARSVDDVQKAMLFARKYNLRVTIQSSGHDYLGRSTADGSFMINLMKMQQIDIDVNSPLNADGVIRVESGNNWGRVYEEVHKHNRIVVGGHASTVAMGGYTLGGGHSPLSRSLGLGVDNLLAVTMVATNGSVVNASASGTLIMSPDGNVTTSSNPDLFWALRGGGGGTFGVVTGFVFKLHKPPSSLSHMFCVFQYNVATDQSAASDFIKFYFDTAKTLPSEWGGYFLGNFDISNHTASQFQFVVTMLHYGPSSLPSFSKFQAITDYHPERQAIKCTKHDYPTFWDYEKQVNDELYIRSTVVAAFVRSSDYDTDLVDWFRDFSMIPPTKDSHGSCANILVGGKVSTVGHDDTAVNPNFRSALGVLSCAVTWDSNPMHDEDAIAAATKLEHRLQALGHGIYMNEPPLVMNNWKRDFWGSHYGRLLRVKKAWDSTNFLTCLYCVGSDLGRNYAHHTATPIIG